MARDDDVYVTGVIVFKTDMAIRFKGRKMREPVWLPRSQTAIINRANTEGFEPGEVTVCLPEWLAEKKGLL